MLRAWGKKTIAVALVAALAPASALAAAPRDVSATHRYLVANYAFLRAVRAQEGRANANIAQLNRTLAGECPGVGAGSPQDEEEQHMSYEVAGAMWSTLYRTDAAAVRRFLGVVGSLRWSDPKITHIERTYVTSLRELATLQLPPLCADVRAWSADGFKAVPTDTLSFDRHVEAIEGKAIPLHLLAPYELPSDRPIAARSARLETDLLNAETTIGFNDWTALLQTLSLGQ